ncbi:MAG: protein kinase, partial [Gemmatimonadales bacterium]
ALAHAHAHGVVHRDIKPDNIMLSGRHAMVTDFGVAKAVSEATGRQTLTTAGVALGTPAYMSPEQAAADPHVDHRADIYAVGVLAYELLTGRPPFIGASPQQVLSAHVTEVPEPVTSRRTTIPPLLDHLVMKCLAKRPADRWQTAEEMLPHLEGLGATPSGGLTPTGTMPVPAVQPRSSSRVAVVAGATVVMAVLGFLGWSSFRSASPAITVSNIRQITRAPEVEYQPVISPSGREVAYTTGFFGTGQVHIAVRDLGGGRAIPLTADRPGSQGGPRWSADGQNVVFTETVAGTSTGVYAIPRFGGPSTAIDAEVIGDIRHDSMAYISGDSLLIQPLGGGEPRLVATVPPGSHSVAWSPDGTRIAAVEGNGLWVDGVNIAPSHIWTVELATGRAVRVTENLSLNVSPQWLPDGRGLLFVSNRNGPRDVYLVWLDGSGARRSDPVRVTTGLNPHSISIADDGSKLVYSQLVFRTNIWELPIPETRSVSLSVAKQVTVGNQTIENHGLSSDGQWLAYDSNRDGNQEIYVMSLAGGEPRQLTTDPGDDFHPDFSPDGSELAFYSIRHGTRDLFLIAADGGNEIRLTDSPNQEYHPTFSPDGLSIAYQEIEAAGRGYIMLLTRDAIGGEWSAPRQLVEVGDGFSDGVRWSPDGRRIVSSRRQRSIVATTLGGQERV